MSTEPTAIKPPGFLWIVLLGVSGFVAGFFGPMIFIPESNLGPIVGILFSGPAGFGLGLVMFLVMKGARLPAPTQWTLLVVFGVAGVLTTLFFVQPEPATRGFEVEIAIERIRPAGESADAVAAEWKTRIAQVTWANPRGGWEEQMRTALAADSGVVAESVLLRQRSIKEHRKPWNRGRLFATPWQPDKRGATSTPPTWLGPLTFALAAFVA
jgi:hypothetical protein